MFLVKSVIPTEPIWTAFIASAAELKLRRAVPHTRPAPPSLLPDIVHPESDEDCWKYGGPMTKYGVPPRKEFQGALHRPSRPPPSPNPTRCRVRSDAWSPLVLLACRTTAASSPAGEGRRIPVMALDYTLAACVFSSPHSSSLHSRVWTPECTDATQHAPVQQCWAPS